MALDVKLPPSEGVENADIAEVYVKEGDTLERDQAICQIETGKATIDVPSPQAGRITKLHIQRGQTVPVGAVLITLETAGGPTPAAVPAAPQPVATSAPTPVAPPQPVAPPPAPVQPVATAPVTQPVTPVRAPAPVAPAPAPVVAHAPVAPVDAGSDDSIFAGPAVRRFAREVGVDLRLVKGTGEGGRIQRDDILRVVRDHSHGGATISAAPTATAVAPATGNGTVPAPAGQSDAFGPVHVERMTKIRKTIAQQMHKSWTSVPRVTNFDDADITELEQLRLTSKDDYAKKGIKLTSMPFLIKAVAMALRDHPVLNASIDMEHEQIIYKQYVNLGIAVDSERGLVVPVLKQADDMSIPEIAKALAHLAENVRNNSFGMSDLQGGTFTISNLGAIGGTYSTPIVNVPEVAILLVGRSRQLPVVIEGEIKPRLMMPLSLSYDHRLVDGASAARFLNDVIGYLKSPNRLLLAP